MKAASTQFSILQYSLFDRRGPQHYQNSTTVSQRIETQDLCFIICTNRDVKSYEMSKSVVPSRPFIAPMSLAGSQFRQIACPSHSLGWAFLEKNGKSPSHSNSLNSDKS
jgi:hypothetical protein